MISAVSASISGSLLRARRRPEGGIVVTLETSEDSALESKHDGCYLSGCGRPRVDGEAVVREKYTSEACRSELFGCSQTGTEDVQAGQPEGDRV